MLVGGSLPDTHPGSFDEAWHGGGGVKLETETGLQPVVEMGARQYHVALGRFLEVDPIEGGVANDYAYVEDPVNASDIDGQGCLYPPGYRHLCRTLKPTKPNPYGCKVKQDRAHFSTHAWNKGIRRIGVTVTVECASPVEVFIRANVVRSSWRGYLGFVGGEDYYEGGYGRLSVYNDCWHDSTYSYKSYVDISVSGPAGVWSVLLYTDPVEVPCVPPKHLMSATVK